MALVTDELIKQVASGELRRARQSLLNSADICLRRAGYDLSSPKRWGGSEATVCGTGYHAGMETYYLWRQENQDPSSDLGPAWRAGWPAPTPDVMEAIYASIEASCFKEVEDKPDFPWDTSFAETVTRAQQMAHAYFEGGHFWPIRYDVVGVEVDFTLPPTVPGWADSGTIDLVVTDTWTGRTILDDHKTARKSWKKGKEYPRSTNQPAFYDEAWERATGVKPDAFSFSIMTYAGQFERRVVYVTEGDRELVHTRKRVNLPLLVEHVEHGLELPGNTSSFLCSDKWCDHWDICPFGGA